MFHRSFPTTTPVAAKFHSDLDPDTELCDSTPGHSDLRSHPGSTPLDNRPARMAHYQVNALRRFWPLPQVGLHLPEILPFPNRTGFDEQARRRFQPSCRAFGKPVNLRWSLHLAE